MYKLLENSLNCVSMKENFKKIKFFILFFWTKIENFNFLIENIKNRMVSQQVLSDDNK